MIINTNFTTNIKKLSKKAEIDNTKITQKLIKKSLMKSIFFGLSIYALIFVLLHSNYVKPFIKDYPIIGRCKIYIYLAILIDIIILIGKYKKVHSSKN